MAEKKAVNQHFCAETPALLPRAPGVGFGVTTYPPLSQTAPLSATSPFIDLLLLTQLPPRGSSQPQHPTNGKDRPALLPQEGRQRGGGARAAGAMGPAMPAHATRTAGGTGHHHREGGPHLQHPAPQLQAHCCSAGQARGAHPSGQHLLLNESTLILSDRVLQATG